MRNCRLTRALKALLILAAVAGFLVLAYHVNAMPLPEGNGDWTKAHWARDDR